MLPWVRKRATQLEANKQHTCIWIAYKTLYSRCFFFFWGIKVLCFQGSLTNAQGFSAPKALSGIPLPLSKTRPWDGTSYDGMGPGLARAQANSLDLTRASFSFVGSAQNKIALANCIPGRFLRQHHGFFDVPGVESRASPIKL